MNPYPVSWQNYFSIAEWFRNENLQEVVVICRKPMLFHLKSGTFTAPYLYSKENTGNARRSEEKKADYVVLDNLGYRQTYEYLYPVIRNNQESFPLFFPCRIPTLIYLNSPRKSKSDMSINTLSIIIPVYNEASTIQQVLDRVCDVKLIQGIKKEIIVINDGSMDQSGEIIENYVSGSGETMKYLSNPKNRGKGASIAAGIREASGDFVVIQDADLEYDPRELNILLEPVIQGYADVVYGSRFLGGKAHRILFFWHSLGNKFLTFLSNMFTNLNLTDMETCYKMIRTSMIAPLTIKEKRFGFEPEITAKLAKIADIRIYEVGISYYGREFKEGKKINWKDGIRAIYCILRYNLFS